MRPTCVPVPECADTSSGDTPAATVNVYIRTHTTPAGLHTADLTSKVNRLSLSQCLHARHIARMAYRAHWHSCTRQMKVQVRIRVPIVKSFDE